MKRKSLLMGMIFIFTAFNFGMFTSGYAKIAEKYKTLAAVNITQSDGIKIPMGAALLKSSLNKSNIYVLDEKQKKVEIAISVDSSGSVILVKPNQQYIVGKSYTLYISRNIFLKNGKHPAEGIKQAFKIKAKVLLPTVGSLENLKKLIEKSNQFGLITSGAGDLVVNFSMADMAKSGDAIPAPGEKAAASEAAAKSAVQGDYSTTNVQVQGVDESDIVKTDGKYIYSISNQALYVVKAIPGEKMEQLDTIKFEDKNFRPNEIYIDSDRNKLIVIGYANPNFFYERLDPQTIPYGQIQTTRVVIYDTSDKHALKNIREVELEGNYLSSRKIGSKLYLITNKGMYGYGYDYGYGLQDTQNLTPSYRDTAKGSKFINIKCDKISYFPESIQANFMLVGVIDISSNKPANVSTYLGSGSNVYMSENNLYVAVSKYDFKQQPVSKTDTKQNVKVMPGIWWPGNQNTNTLVYKFKVNENSVEYAASGEVPGIILNQFSMDENKDTFRIATTKGDVWAQGENISKNNLYILDQEMKVCGSLVDMAPGEKIYSVRFMADRAYIVTYKKVDPLFVIDLKDKTKPQILGALKIPGYSDYLHPYDENHIIGFGKDSMEIPYKDGSGNVVGTNAYYLGMKVALFDVSDVAKPKEISHVIIGDRGTSSPLLYDHKALMISKEKNLMAFPVTEYKLQEGSKVVTEQNGYAFPEYGHFSYQGAFVFSIDVGEGFVLKGKITHLTQEEYLKAGNSGYNYLKDINRILYIGDTLYTNSGFMIKANKIDDLKEMDRLELK